MSLLECRGVSKVFGGVAALDEVDLEVERGEIVGLIGPNGSGKSTLVNVITGFYAPDEGEVLFSGIRIDGLKPHVLRRRGIARTFQDDRPWGNLTAESNLLVGAHTRFLGRNGSAWGWLTALIGMPSARRREAEVRAAAADATASVGLAGFLEHRASDLSYGQTKRLQLARTMMAPVAILLLDEPTSGVPPDAVDGLLATFVPRVRSEGLSVVLVEHRMEVITGVCDRVVVLDAGRVIAQGTHQEVMRDQKVRDVYLG